jgi:hypothetical protein
VNSWRSLLSAWLGAFLLFASVAHGNLENLDSAATMHAARALYLRGDSGLRRFDQGAEWLGEGLLTKEIADRQRKGVHWYGKVGRNGLTYVWFPVGHVWLMVPFVALGEALAERHPEVERHYLRTVAPGVEPSLAAESLSYRDNHLVFANAVVATLLPAICGATIVLLLYGIARALGASGRDAALSTAAITLATQVFPLGRETLSDGPGLMFLLAALLAVVRANAGTASLRTALLGGAALGAAVLCRYAHGLLAPMLILAVVVAARRTGRWGLLAWFLVGGLPFLILLVGVNHARYGAASDTGYPSFASWFNYPLAFGLLKLLVAAGKGVLWLSPMLWLVLPAARRPLPLRWLAWGLFAVPMVLFSMTLGWQSGQCWSARYVTPGVVSLCALVLPQARPWLTHPRWFLALLAVGALVSLTSVVTPTRGHNQLAGQAVRAMYDRELAAGLITPADRSSVDEADHFYFLPRFSPLHAHWTYAVKSWRGDFEGPDGRPRHGSANTIEPLFGIVAVPDATPPQDLAPMHWEDRGGRHLWWVFWGSLYGFPGWWLFVPVWLGGLACSWIGWRHAWKSGAAVPTAS